MSSIDELEAAATLADSVGSSVMKPIPYAIVVAKVKGNALTLERLLRLHRNLPGEMQDRKILSMIVGQVPLKMRKVTRRSRYPRLCTKKRMKVNHSPPFPSLRDPQTRPIQKRI